MSYVRKEVYLKHDDVVNKQPHWKMSAKMRTLSPFGFNVTSVPVQIC